MLFVGGGVAHQEIRSDNWQLKPSVLRDDVEDHLTSNSWQASRQDTGIGDPDIHSEATATSNTRGSGLIIRIPPLSAFPLRSSAVDDRHVVPDDEEIMSNWSCADSSDSDPDSSLE